MNTLHVSGVKHLGCSFPIIYFCFLCHKLIWLYWFVLMPITPYFDYYSFVIYFEIREYDICSFVILKIAWAVWFICVSLQSLGLFHFCEQLHWNFDRDWIEFVDCLGEYGSFENINSSHLWVQNIFPFMSSWMSFINVL